MKRPRSILVLCIALASTLSLAMACGSDNEKTAAQLDTANGKKQGKTPNDNPPATKEKEKEIKTMPQAIKALQSWNDAQVAEAEIGKTRTSTPEVKSYAESIATDYANANAQLQKLAQDKGITPQSSTMSDRIKFQSDGSLSHLKNVGTDMFDNAYMTRASSSQKLMLTNIDEDIAPVITDQDIKNELAQIRADAAKHVADADAVGKAAEDKGKANPPPVADGGTGVPAPGAPGGLQPPPDDPEGKGAGGGAAPGTPAPGAPDTGALPELPAIPGGGALPALPGPGDLPAFPALPAFPGFPAGPGGGAAPGAGAPGGPGAGQLPGLPALPAADAGAP